MLMSLCTFLHFVSLLLLAATLMVRGGGGGGGGRFEADFPVEDPDIELAVEGLSEDLLGAEGFLSLAAEAEYLLDADDFSFGWALLVVF
jgi:hypothetical protein